VLAPNTIVLVAPPGFSYFVAASVLAGDAEDYPLEFIALAYTLSF
jgi:hypothetical protein